MFQPTRSVDQPVAGHARGGPNGVNNMHLQASYT